MSEVLTKLTGDALKAFKVESVTKLTEAYGTMMRATVEYGNVCLPILAQWKANGQTQEQFLTWIESAKDGPRLSRSQTWNAMQAASALPTLPDEAAGLSIGALVRLAAQEDTEHRVAMYRKAGGARATEASVRKAIEDHKNASETDEDRAKRSKNALTSAKRTLRTRGIEAIFSTFVGQELTIGVLTEVLQASVALFVNAPAEGEDDPNGARERQARIRTAILDIGNGLSSDKNAKQEESPGEPQASAETDEQEPSDEDLGAIEAEAGSVQ